MNVLQFPCISSRALGEVRDRLGYSLPFLSHPIVFLKRLSKAGVTTLTLTWKQQSSATKTPAHGHTAGENQAPHVHVHEIQTTFLFGGDLSVVPETQNIFGSILSF